MKTEGVFFVFLALFAYRSPEYPEIHQNRKMTSETSDQLKTGNTIPLCEGNQDVEAGFNPLRGKVEVFPKPNLPEGQESSLLNPNAEEFVPKTTQQQIPASAVEMPGNMMTPLDVQFGDLEFESTENSAFTFGGNESVSSAYSSSVASSTSSSMSNHVSGQIGQLSQASDSMIPTSRITPSPLSALEQSSPRNNALYQPSPYTTPVKKEPVENKQELKRENRYPPVSLKDRKIAELEKANLEKERRIAELEEANFEKDRRIAELEGFQDLHEDKPEKKKQKAGILQGYSEVVKQKGSANTNVSNLPSTAAVEQETGSSSKVSDEDRFFYILSTIPKAKIEPKADIRYHVFGEVLDYRDFQSLEGDGWLTITVMNAFLLILKEEQNIYVLPSHMAVLWSNDQYKSFLLKKIHLSVFEWIFMAINVNNCHWVLLAANVPSKKVSILDSLKNDNQNLIEQWKMYMQIRGNLVGELTGEWKTGDLESSDQKDNSSCGPFTLMNALAIASSIQTKSLSQGHALHMRKCIKDKLLSVAKTCNEVGCSKPEQGKLWNQYNKCASWSHHICANIAEKPIGDNVCPVCEAEYK